MEFLNARFSTISYSAKMLELLERFENLNLKCLTSCINSKYEATMVQFMQEIEQVRQVKIGGEVIEPNFILCVVVSAHRHIKLITGLPPWTATCPQWPGQ